MALDDRDRSFEKALAIRLRASTPGAACPDAETLAAYHERSLTFDELTSWKTHIATCANCQQILAHLETLEEIPHGPRAEEEASGKASELIEAAAVTAVAPKKASVVSVAQLPRRPRVAHWRWIVPVGAIAASLLVWVAVHENQPPAVLPATKIEIAQSRPPADETKLAAPAPAKPADVDKLSPLSKAAPSTGERASASSALQNRRGMPAPKSAASTLLADRSEPVTVDSQSAQLFANTQDSKDAKIAGLTAGVAPGTGTAVGGAVSRQEEKKFDEPAREDQAMNYVAAPPPAAPKPQAAGQTGPLFEKDAKQLPADQSASATPPSDELKQPSPGDNAIPMVSRSAAETVEATSAPAAAPALRVAKSRAPRTVAAPGGKVIWHLGLNGFIEQSLDGGQTWTPQTSGTAENLFLGSAPSEQVCWVISTSGTILRTTDGGVSWLPVVSPMSQNLGFIRASDALHATVWDMSRRHIFQTSDGGTTWTPASAH
jgi:hypothetical protein